MEDKHTMNELKDNLPKKESERAFWTNERVRHTFIKYFVEKDHVVVKPSSVLPPPQDTSLLFVNSGMVQFKPFFLGQRQPDGDQGHKQIVSSLEEFKGSRVCNSQRCIRVSNSL